MTEIPAFPNSDSERERTLLGENGLFGTREAFCTRLFEALRHHFPEIETSSDPVAAIGAQTKSDLLRMFYVADISLDEVMPVTLSLEQAEMKIKLQFAVLAEVTRPPDPFTPEEAERLQALREKFRPDTIIQKDTAKR